jgi:hypothetical protein
MDCMGRKRKRRDHWQRVCKLIHAKEDVLTVSGERPEDRKMTKDEMVEWFKSAPKGSRHERMLWTARKIAHLTGVTEGRAYKMLLVALIETEED